jgi:hypothetical protein
MRHQKASKQPNKINLNNYLHLGLTDKTINASDVSVCEDYALHDTQVWFGHIPQI